MAVGAWGIAPSEFWQMTVTEWWWLYDVKQAQMSGGMTDSGWKELYDFTFGDDG